MSQDADLARGYHGWSVSSKRPSQPYWWKNTFFWFGFALLGLALWGLVKGDGVIRDPGQVRESTSLVMLYFVASVAMLINGWMTHQQAVQNYEEVTGEQVARPTKEAVDLEAENE